MEGDKKPEGEGVEDFSKGPLSVLWHSVKNNTQVRFCVLGFHGVYVYDSPSSAFGIQPPSTQPSTPTHNTPLIKHKQVLVNVRNNHKLLGRVKAFDRHCNLYVRVHVCVDRYVYVGACGLDVGIRSAARAGGGGVVGLQIKIQSHNYRTYQQPKTNQAAGEREGNVDGGAQVGQGQEVQAGAWRACVGWMVPCVCIVVCIHGAACVWCCRYDESVGRKDPNTHPPTHPHPRKAN